LSETLEMSGSAEAPEDAWPPRSIAGSIGDSPVEFERVAVVLSDSDAQQANVDSNPPANMAAILDSLAPRFLAKRDDGRYTQREDIAAVFEAKDTFVRRIGSPGHDGVDFGIFAKPPGDSLTKHLVLVTTFTIGKPVDAGDKG